MPKHFIVFFFTALPRLQHLIMMANDGTVKITLRVLERGVHYRKLLKDVSKKAETKVAFDVPVTHIEEMQKYLQ